MITILLVIANVIVFFLIRSGKLDAEELSVSYHTVYNRKEYKRIITSAFTHVDIMHIVFNMISLIFSNLNPESCINPIEPSNNIIYIQIKISKLYI